MTAVAYYILFVLLAAAVKLLLWKLQLLWGTNHFITRTDFARLLAVLLLLHQGMDVTVQWGMRQEHVVASFCAHWPVLSVLTPTLQTCGQAVRPFTHDVPGRSSLSFRIFFIIIIIYFFTFFCVHLQSCAWLHISTVCLLVLVCVSACQGEQDLQLAPSEYSPTHPSLIIMQQPHWQMHIHTEGRGVFCHCQALITALWFAHTEWLRLLFFLKT